MNDCIFCRIIQGEAPAQFVYQDKDVVAFHDINPSSPVEVLIVPVEHIESINALEAKHRPLIAEMIMQAKELAMQLGIANSGYKLLINTGRDAGQIIFHLHIHLIGGWNR